MLSQLRLVHFKGFDLFTVSFGSRALLVGPNNAGKSTIISALRLAGAAARQARRRKPVDTYQDGERWVHGFPMSMAQGSGFVDENVRHEFRAQEARVELKFKSGAVLNLVWPTEGPAFFWVHDPSGPNAVSISRAKELLDVIGVVPALTPLEYEEERRESK